MNMTAIHAPSGATAVREIDHWINGEIATGAEAERGKVYNPATGAVSGVVAMGGQAEVDRAVAAAQAAFESWSATPSHIRARVMFRFRDLVESHRDRLAEIITNEHGKVFNDAQGEVTRGMEVVEFACGIPHMLKGEFSENVGRTVDGVTFRQPLGPTSMRVTTSPDSLDT